MKPDEEMIREALAETRGKAREAMLDRVQAYRSACALSKGPSPERSTYWQEKAARYALEIKRMTPSRPAPGVGQEQCA